jgi:hypothetical protein
LTGVELVWGKRRRPGGASLRLLTRTEGRPTTTSNTAAPPKPKAARATEVGEDSWVGRSGRVGRMPLGPARREKKSEMGCKDDRAEMILGCAEKKKKVFQILIQGMIFKSKF